MWESISTISAIVAATLLLIFLLLLFEKAVYTKSGFYLQGAILIFAALFCCLYYYVSNYKIEISAYQYAQLYELYKDENKDNIIKKDIRRGLSDGMFSKHELNKLKENHLEPLIYADSMSRFAEVLPNIEINYGNSTNKLLISLSVSMIYMLRMIFVMGIFVFAFIYVLRWSQYHKAVNTQPEINSELRRQAIDRWSYMRSKKGLQTVGLMVSFSVVGLMFTELCFNDVTSTTKDIVISYGEANKNVPTIYDAVQAALLDNKITADEYQIIESIGENVVVEYIKQSIHENELKTKLAIPN